MDAFVTWVSENVPVAAAIVTASVSGLVSLIALFANPFVSANIEKLKSELNRQLEAAKADAQRQIEEHKANLADANSERVAKRDYEYEARKRLYEHVEPLMFQLHEAAEGAKVRVASLCRTSRSGDLGLTGWLSEHRYYLRSTAYRLLLPAAILRLLQRRMTFIDMKLDAAYARTYSLLKLYMGILADDYGVASASPALPYRPEETGVTNPTHRKQGVYMGHLESMMDAMLVRDGDVTRPCTYAEFDSLLSLEPDKGPFRHIVSLFLGFRPSEHTILARTVHLLGIASHLLAKSTEKPDSWNATDAASTFLASADVLEGFAWESGKSPHTDTYIAYLQMRFVA